MKIERNTNSSSPKCVRPGPSTRNPYLNFLRQYRKDNCGMTAVELIVNGAKEWKKLTNEQKCKYIAEAFHTTPYRYRPKSTQKQTKIAMKKKYKISIVKRRRKSTSKTIKKRNSMNKKGKKIIHKK